MHEITKANILFACKWVKNMLRQNHFVLRSLHFHMKTVTQTRSSGVSVCLRLVSSCLVSSCLLVLTGVIAGVRISNHEAFKSIYHVVCANGRRNRTISGWSNIKDALTWCFVSRGHVNYHIQIRIVTHYVILQIWSGK